MTNDVNVLPRSEPGSVDDQAREWFVYFVTEEGSDPDRIQEWIDWMDASPEHRQAYKRVSDIWSAVGAVEPNRPNTRAVEIDQYTGSVSISAWRRRSRRFRLVSTILTLLLLLFVPGLFISLYLPTHQDHYLTARAQHLSTTLPDGSRIELGAMATVDVDFGLLRRDLSLTTGEALFHVAHESTRPFVVATPLGSLEAVGTVFNVDVRENEIRLNVVEGVVKASLPRPGKAPDILLVSKGAGLRMMKNGSELLMKYVVFSAPKWPGRLLEYRNEPLRSILQDVNRYSSRKIVLDSAISDELAYTGTLQLDEIDQWLNAVASAFDLQIDTHDAQSVLLKKVSAN